MSGGSSSKHSVKVPCFVAGSTFERDDLFEDCTLWILLCLLPLLAAFLDPTWVQILENIFLVASSSKLRMGKCKKAKKIRGIYCVSIHF